MHTHNYITHIYINIYTQIPTYRLKICTHSYVHTHTHIYIYIYIYMHSCINKYIPEYIHI